MFINNFDPVAIQIFSIEIRWYSLAYIFGILIGWLYCKKILIKDKNISKLFDDLISYLIIGIILGGRLGYVIFYNLEYFSNNPIEILMIWHGGMSFHGGLLGVLASTIIYAKKHNVNKKIWNKLISSKFKPELKKSIKNITNNHELKKVFKKVYTDKKFKKQIEKDKTIFFLVLQIIKTNMNK